MPMPAIDMRSLRFGKLLVLSRFGGPPRPKWLCKCDCGKLTVKDGSRLRSGGVKSCGCSTSEFISKARTVHGMTGTRLENIRRGMVARCYRKYRPDYLRYGGRGISICQSWLNNPASFYKWALANGYQDSLSIDRIDSNGNYAPENCRWIPLSENVAKANRSRRAA